MSNQNQKIDYFLEDGQYLFSSYGVPPLEEQEIVVETCDRNIHVFIVKSVHLNVVLNLNSDLTNQIYQVKLHARNFNSKSFIK